MAVEAEALNLALSRVRPLILGHGGDIEVTSISTEGVVEVRLVGVCRTCPNIAMTYVGPIRSGLLTVPGVSEVRCAQVHASPRTLARMARLLGAAPVPVA